jgi:hypothetical protein
MSKILETINVGFFTNAHAKSIINERLSSGWGIDAIVVHVETRDSWVTFYRYENFSQAIKRLFLCIKSRPK